MTKRMSFSHRLRKDEEGNLALMFGLLVVPVVMLFGVSMDYGRGYTVRAEMQSSLDSAVLAAGRAFDATGDTHAAEEAGAAYFKNTYPGNVDAQVTQVDADGQGNIRMSAKAEVPTAFLRMAGQEAVEVSVSSESLTTDGGGMDVELAIVFDVTGSMRDYNRMTMAKQAAEDLIDIMLPDSPQARSVRISLVPFDNMVNFGPSLTKYVTNHDPVETVQEPYQTRDCTRYWSNGSCRTWGPYYTAYRTVTYYTKPCTVERMSEGGAQANDRAFNDENPVDSRFHAFQSTNSPGSCSPAYPIVPLTSNTQTLLDAIDDFQPGGSTAGHIGTAWGWYTISPNWQGAWPSGSVPAARDDAHLLKAVLIMTDGDYNRHYNSNWSTNSENGNDWNAANGSSASQAIKICDNMKAQGVEVFAVGLEISSSARNMLLQCVSDPNNLFEKHYYDVANADGNSAPPAGGCNWEDGISGNNCSETNTRTAFQGIANSITSATGTGNARLRITR